MRNQVTGIGLAAALAMAPALVFAQESGIAIEHKAVECIVAGKFPKMNACFTPKSNVARARVYFRPEGVQSWYYVEMKADAPCLAGVLPRPRKELVTKHIDYHIQVTDKNFAEGLTADYHPVVVNSEDECKDKPVAAYLSKAAVQVFPGMAPGFAGAGIGTAAVVGIGAGVVGVAAGGVAIANNGGSTVTQPPATQPPPVITQPPVTQPPPVITEPPVTQPQGFKFVFKISPDPPKGVDGFKATIDMCDSLPKGNKIKFSIDFGGDGFEDVGNKCTSTKTMTMAGALGRASPATTLPPCIKFPAIGCAVPHDGSAAQECRQRKVEVCPVGSISALSAGSVRIKPRVRDGNPVASRRLAWNSELAVDGGTGQVVANGSAAVFASKGRSSAVASGRKGENRIEAQLVQGSGRPGTWRFELGPTPSFEAGSLRVIAGEVAQITGDAVVFRLKGQPGERVVFTFRTTR